MTPYLKRLLLAVGLSTLCTASYAQSDSELAGLASIDNELAIIRGKLKEIKRKADMTGRVQFQYDALDNDLKLIQRGIREHLDAPRQPKPVAPLRGDYRQ